MSTTPDRPQDPPQGGFPPPPPPGATPPGPPPSPGTAGGSGTGPVPPGHVPGTGGHGVPPLDPPPGYGYAGPPPPGTPGQGGPGGPGGYGPGQYGPPGAPGYPPPAYGPGAPLSPSDQRLWAVLGHLGNLLVWIIAPLVVWLVFRGRGAFLEDHAKESVNFQITAALAAIALTVVTVVTFGIGGLLYIPFGIAWLVLIIIAAVKASQGEPYRYPLTLRLVK